MSMPCWPLVLLPLTMTEPRLTHLKIITRLSERCDDGGDRGRKRTRSSPEPGTSAGSGRRSGSAVCSRHGSPLDVYCCTDGQIICAGCAAAEHTGHSFDCVREERRRKQEELKRIQTKSKQILHRQENKFKKMRKTRQQIQEEGRKTKDYCEAVLVGIMDSLQTHYLSVRELIQAQEKAAAAQIQVSLQTLQEKMEDTRKRSAALDRLAQMDGDVLFLQKWPSLQRLCEKEHLHALPGLSEDPLRPFELTRGGVEDLGKRLEEFCDKEFASISQDADRGGQQESVGESEEGGGHQRCEASTSKSYGLYEVTNILTEQTAEPKTRAEFLQYACCLRLDPCTAHEDLAISAGDQQVRLSPTVGKSPAFRPPERFLHRRQVLCREGLQAERCYYEIEVVGDKAEIALAYKGIDRKSRTTLSAFGATNMSWSLDRSRKYSVSHRGDSVQLTTPPGHKKIGVYLKFKEGSLSFYEVSDSMRFLYELEAEFTEPLYPGFWLGENCCIRICDL